MTQSSARPARLHDRTAQRRDAKEAAEAWRTALAQTGPCCRAGRCPRWTAAATRRPAAWRGAHILADNHEDGTPEIILMATGGEVSPCVTAYKQLAGEGIGVRVVSMPSWGLFEAQDAAYRCAVLSPEVTARIAVEAAAALGWDRHVGATSEIVAVRGFGASAPFEVLLPRFGFTSGHVLAVARRQLVRARQTA